MKAFLAFKSLLMNVPTSNGVTPVHSGPAKLRSNSLAPAINYCAYINLTRKALTTTHLLAMNEMSKRNNQITVRFTDLESGFLSWYAKHIDTDRPNSIRHVLSSFLADHDQLVAYKRTKSGFNTAHAAETAPPN